MNRVENALTTAIKMISAVAIISAILFMFFQSAGWNDCSIAQGQTPTTVPVHADVSHKTFAATTAKIIGPDTLDVKESDLYVIEGIDAKALAESNVVAFPEDALRISVLLTKEGTPTLYVKAVKPGRCVLIGDINVPGAYGLVKKEIVVGGTQPNPPLPPVPQPGGKKQVAFLIESADLDNLSMQQQALLNSLTLRKKLAEKGHKLVGVWDKDTAGAQPANAAWFAAGGGKYPCVLIAPMDGGDIKAYPLPADEAAFWKVVE